MIELDDGPGIKRGRGGFYRDTKDTPYVTDPSGAVCKTGPRKGEPKRLPYGSPSSFGKQVENTTNLTKWGERMVVAGIGANLELVRQCITLADPSCDRDSKEWKAAADAAVVAAKAAADAALAADRGTHVHGLTETRDGGGDVIYQLSRGEVLGLGREVQLDLVSEWIAMLDRHDLLVVNSETSVVHDGYRQAGTLDRIVLTTKPLRFILDGGEVREIPAGVNVVLDIKTGKRRTDAKGVIEFWNTYAVQIAAYAGGVPYDTENETRGEWGFDISQEHALIAHLDVLGAMNGNPSCELVYVDLAAGRAAADLCIAAKAWEKRRDVFSVAIAPDPEIAAPPVPFPEVEQPASEPPADNAGPQVAPRTIDQQGDDTCPENSPTTSPNSATTPSGTPSREPGSSPTNSPTRTALSTAQSPSRSSTGTTDIPTPTPSRADQLARVPTSPTEGDPVDDATFDALQRAYEALTPSARAWVKELATQATQAHVSFHAKGNKTTRRFELLRGLVELAQHGADDDETLRCVLETVIGDVARFPAVPTGHVLGSLGHTEAVLFARRAQAFATSEVPGAVDNDGVLHLSFTEEAA